MPLCEHTTGWWFWKKPCTRWADGACAHCGGRFCATHLRHVDSALSCRACSSGDDSWDTQASSHFSGSSHRSDDVSADSALDSSVSSDSSSTADSSVGSDVGGGSSD